jgi:hypothetical protein
MAGKQASSALISPKFELLETPGKPVIDYNHPGAKDNKYGFEGGSAVKAGDTYHLFVSEMCGDPFWTKMRLALWTSGDAVKWSRVSTLYETSGKPGTQRDSLWSPMPVFNGEEGRWDLFYVAYEDNGWTNGKIWRATSKVKGMEGISGPYEDAGVIMRPDKESQSWEGGQGVDSFYPYQVKGKWHALYGSHKLEPGSAWSVGLAKAPRLAGPWKRLREGNPLLIEPLFIENPIVTVIPGSGGKGSVFTMIYDSCKGTDSYVEDGHNVGYSVSADGVNWLPGGRITVQPESKSNWSADIRTPQCLINEGNGIYTMLYTGKLKDRKFWSVGMVKLGLTR